MRMYNGNTFTDKNQQLFFDAPQSEKITIVIFNSCTFFKINLAQLAASLKILTNLQDFSFNYCSYDDQSSFSEQDIGGLADAIKDKPLGVLSLMFHNKNLVSQVNSAFTVMINNINPYTIEKLLFCDMGLNDNAIDAICNLIKQAVKLDELNLSGNKLNDNNVSQLIAALKTNNSIKKLTLNDCGLSESARLDLTEMHKTHHSLKYLDIGKFQSVVTANTQTPEATSYVYSIWGGMSAFLPRLVSDFIFKR